MAVSMLFRTHINLPVRQPSHPLGDATLAAETGPWQFPALGELQPGQQNNSRL